MMSRQTEVRLCHPCGVETHHFVILVRKPSSYQDHPHRKWKEFIAGVVKGWALEALLHQWTNFLATLSVKTAVIKRSKTSFIGSKKAREYSGFFYSHIELIESASPDQPGGSKPISVLCPDEWFYLQRQNPAHILR